MMNKGKSVQCSRLETTQLTYATDAWITKTKNNSALFADLHGELVISCILNLPTFPNIKSWQLFSMQFTWKYQFSLLIDIPNSEAYGSLFFFGIYPNQDNPHSRRNKKENQKFGLK